VYALFSGSNGGLRLKGEIFMDANRMKRELGGGAVFPIGAENTAYAQYFTGECYLNMLTSGRLNGYLADIEEQAQERFERLVEQMKQAQGITEQLKVENVLEWIGRMNNIQVCAREIVDKEIIYQE